MGPTKTSRAAKTAPAAAQSLPDRTFIIDNGAHTLKAGYAPTPASLTSTEDNISDSLAPCILVPNALTRVRDGQVYIGTQLDTHITDWNEAFFRRPVEKGFIVNWEAQRAIWDHSFFDEKTARRTELRCTDPVDTTLILTEAPNAMAALQKNADEIVMEEWGFGGYMRCVGRLSYLGISLSSCLVQSVRVCAELSRLMSRSNIKRME